MKYARRVIAFVFCLAFIGGIGIVVDKLVRSTVETRTVGQRSIVSLGDSVAAGAGLSERGGRNPSQACDTSESSYADLLGRTLDEPVTQFACSGATIAPTGTNKSNTVLGSQLPAAKAFLQNADVVITVGANDIGWLSALTNCATKPCISADDPALQQKITSMQQNMSQLISQVQAAKPHKVIVNTYYGLLRPGDTCFSSFGITQPKILAINQLEAKLNGAITAATLQAGAHVVAIDFIGHELCSSNSWIQGFDGGAPLHPNAAGQQQIANQDLKALR